MTQPSEHVSFYRQNLFKVKNEADINKKYYIVFSLLTLLLLIQKYAIGKKTKNPQSGGLPSLVSMIIKLQKLPLPVPMELQSSLGFSWRKHLLQVNFHSESSFSGHKCLFS